VNTFGPRAAARVLHEQFHACVARCDFVERNRPAASGSPCRGRNQAISEVGFGRAELPHCRANWRPSGDNSPMPVLSSEAVVLRTWPLREADLIVSFFTRDYGRVKGVAKAALKSRKRFGGALEPMTLARAWFAERPGQELVRLDQLEILRSPLSAPIDQTRMVVLSFFAEVIDEALPEHDPQDAVFRLLVSVLEHTTREQPWMPLTYFSLWMTRLMGVLPDIARCIVCGEALALHAEKVSYSSSADGLFCGLHANGSATALSADSWQLAQRMLRAPASAFAAERWPRRRGQDLRRFTLQTLERHLERKLKSAEALARL
jgi:DNA repair protein RecO (recombination protein O)